MKLLFLLLSAVAAQNDHLFNYGETEDGNFGPEDWDKVACDDLDTCTGWPEKWAVSQGWELRRNSCKHCPVGNSQCGTHHQSPIELKRRVALSTSNQFNICRDQHWMKYEDGSCSWEQLKDSFTIERHSLKLAQPIDFDGTFGDGYEFRLDCPGPDGAPRRFGRIDFSWGFNFWWFLAHIDIKIPSEHTQNGKRYSAEVQMAHFFSTEPGNDRNDNEMATIAVFLEVEEDSPPYPHLDRMICEWRKAEAKTRRECALPLIEDAYPGCFEPLHAEGTNNVRRDEDNINVRRRTMEEVLREAAETGDFVHLEDSNYRDADQTDEEFTAFIEDYSKRNLIEQDHLSFHNYQFLIDSKTEYYHRYHGTQTIPPCYGPVLTDSYARTNHWRIMKDPIRIAPRQIVELERLLKERIAPSDAVHNACLPDTAGTTDTDGDNTISVARPLQATHVEHDAVFCWCPIWPSKWPEDRAWCELNKQQGDAYVLYDHPYNFDSSSF